MSRMIDLIRQSAVPANMIRSAARGALSLPAAEMLEILVELSSRPPFADQAQLTLAGWNEASARAVLADPQAPAAVLDYFSSATNLRVPLLPVLLDNPSVPETALTVLAASHSAEVLAAMLQSARVRQSVELLNLLERNPYLPTNLLGEAREALTLFDGAVHQLDVQQYLAEHPEETAQCLAEHPEEITAAESRTAVSAGSPAGEAQEELAFGGTVYEHDIQQYLTEHQEEIRAAENVPFYLTDSTTEEQSEVEAAISNEEPVAASAKVTVAAEHDRLSQVQKIAKMKVGERVMLALKGTREDRFILVRDGARVVSNAVLESPRLNDQEIEAYAGMRNVAESVLRTIAAKRQWMRYYPIVRALARNPRTPIDISVPLMKGLLMQDLKGLTANKEIPDTVRNIALRLFRERTEERRK